MELTASVVFVLGVLMMISAIWINSKKDSTAGDETLKKINAVQADNQYLKTLINSMQSSDSSMAERVVRLEGELLHVKGDAVLCGTELNNLKERCDKLKDSQIGLQEKLSNKRPVIMVKEMPKSQVAIDLIQNGQGIDALLKPRGKKAKETNGSN